MVIISVKKQNEIGLTNFTISEPINKIIKNKKKTKRLNVEREFINLLEFNNSVYCYYEKLFEISFIYHNDVFSVIPDFYVKYHDETQEVFNIFNSNKKKYSTLEVEIVKQFCFTNNIKYTEVGENEILDTYILFNSNFLLNYKRPKYGYKQSDTFIIYDVLYKYKKLTVKKILDNSLRSDEKKEQLLYVIWVMIANYLICFDETKKLSMNTEVWIKKYE